MPNDFSIPAKLKQERSSNKADKAQNDAAKKVAQLETEVKSLKEANEELQSQIKELKQKSTAQSSAAKPDEKKA